MPRKRPSTRCAAARARRSDARRQRHTGCTWTWRRDHNYHAASLDAGGAQWELAQLLAITPNVRADSCTSRRVDGSPGPVPARHIATKPMKSFRTRCQKSERGFIWLKLWPWSGPNFTCGRTDGRANLLRSAAAPTR